MLLPDLSRLSLGHADAEADVGMKEHERRNWIRNESARMKALGRWGKRAQKRDEQQSERVSPPREVVGPIDKEARRARMERARVEEEARKQEEAEREHTKRKKPFLLKESYEKYQGDLQDAKDRRDEATEAALDEFKDAKEDAYDEEFDEIERLREDYREQKKAFAKGSSERADLKAAITQNITEALRKLNKKTEALEEKRDAQLKKIEDDYESEYNQASAARAVRDREIKNM